MTHPKRHSIRKNKYENFFLIKFPPHLAFNNIQANITLFKTDKLTIHSLTILRMLNQKQTKQMKILENIAPHEQHFF